MMNKFLYRKYAILSIFCLLGFTFQVHEALGSSSKGKISPLQFAEKAVGKVVPSDNAHQLRQEGEDIVFVSVREMAEWDEYHIPGAISIPHSRLKEMTSFHGNCWKNSQKRINMC